MTPITGSAARFPPVRGDDVPFREAEIDLAQLARNLARFREAAGDGPVGVDVGADAWGHGIDVVVPALTRLGVQAFIVARSGEAERIRGLAPAARIVTTQHHAAETFETAARHNLTPALRSRSECERAIAAGVRSIILVPDDGAALPAMTADQLSACAADASTHGVEVVELSAQAWIGAELFGVAEDDPTVASGFRPVLRLWAPVAATKRVGADEGVSYGYTYRTTGQTTLALVTLGYADGISRAGGNRVEARISGATYPIAGRVAMDAFMVDLGDVAAPALGSAATVLGDAERGEPTAIEQGRMLGLPSAEVTTRLTARPRRYGVEGTR